MLGPETVAGFLTEPAQGAGMIHPPKEYFPQIREMTQRLGILWLDDEVMTGFGRLGEWFGYKCYDVTPDIMAVAKGLISSALPAGGVVLSKEVAEFFDKWRFSTMSTFGSHPLAMAAICANLEAMVEENILERVRDLGAHLGAGLNELQQKHPCLGLASGRGLMWALELVRNKETREPFIGVDRYSIYAEDGRDAGQPDRRQSVHGGGRSRRRVPSEQHSVGDRLCRHQGGHRPRIAGARQGALGTATSSATSAAALSAIARHGR